MHYIKRITQTHKDYSFEYNKNINILVSQKNLNPYTAISHLQTWNHTKKHLEAQEQPNLGGGSP